MANQGFGYSSGGGEPHLKKYQSKWIISPQDGPLPVINEAANKPNK